MFGFVAIKLIVHIIAYENFYKQQLCDRVGNKCSLKRFFALIVFEDAVIFLKNYHVTIIITFA